jgi:plasmid stability protein
MAALTLSNLPDDLLGKLKDRAAQHGRTVEAEAVECLQLATQEVNGADRIERMLEDLKRFRDSLSPDVRLEEESLSSAKREGRP